MTHDDYAALAELPEMNPGPVFRLALDGTVELANPAARELYGEGDLLGRDWKQLCPQLEEAQWRLVLSGTQRVSCTSELQGRTFLFRLAHRVGSPNVFVYGSDISELKQAEAKLADLAQFPEMNPGPVYRLDTNGVIVLANRAAREFLGHEVAVGEYWLDLLPGVNRAFLDRVLATEGTHAIEARKGGRDFVFHHVRAPSGREVFVYGADVTEEKAAERTVLRTEKMATLGTLAAGVAHELNNPAAAAARAADHLRDEFAKLQRAELTLDALTMSATERERLSALHERVRESDGSLDDLDPIERSDVEDALERWLDEQGLDDPWELVPLLADVRLETDELDSLAAGLEAGHLEPVLDWLVHLHGVYRLLEEIKHGAGRVSEIVAALKSYSYLGQAPVQDVDVNEGIRQTLVILRNKLKVGVQVRQELAPDLPRIQAYGGELNQVWTNLIDNAVSAMGGQGTLDLRSRSNGEWIEIDVVDDGPGIPGEISDRIFDPFFTTKPPGEGVGLGLHTCHSIVAKKHGGKLDVDSRPGETRFTVHLPIRGPEPERQQQDGEGPER